MIPYDDILELPRTVKACHAVFGNLEAENTLRAQGIVSEHRRAIGRHDKEGRNYILAIKDSLGEAEAKADEFQPSLSPGAKIVVGRLYYE